MNTPPQNWVGLLEFRSHLAQLGGAVPEAVEQALTQRTRITEYADNKALPDGLLTADPAALQRAVDALSIRRHDGDRRFGGGQGLWAGAHPLLEHLWSETVDAVVPELDHVIAGLQPGFDEAAAALTTAAQTYQFTWRTTSDDVIDLADEQASAVWRASRTSWHALEPYVTLYRSMTEVFGIAPTGVDVTRATFGTVHTPEALGHPDLTVAFAAASNWSFEGRYYVDNEFGPRSTGIDWFALAVGGLHLNTPTETAAKIADYYNRRLASPLLD